MDSTEKELSFFQEVSRKTVFTGIVMIDNNMYTHHSQISSQATDWKTTKRFQEASRSTLSLVHLIILPP